MGWISAIGGFWLTTAGWLLGLGVVLGVLARLRPCNPGMFWWKDLRAARTDAVYWLLVPLVMFVGRTGMLAAGVVLLYGGRDPDPLPVAGWPLWLQALAVLVVQDIILYGLHRLFHTRLGWRFHAVHHSPRVLDWTAVTRSHPVNYLLEFTVADAVVLLAGFPPAAVLALAPFNTAFSALVHANLNWTFGPLRWVIASPVFHRWHHTTQEEGRDKNFASTFPLLDVVFGTFYMPPGRLPERFGTDDAEFPDGFWGQFAHPFRPGGTGRRPAAALIGVVAAACVAAGGWFIAAAQTAGPGAGAESAAANLSGEEPDPAGPFVPNGAGGLVFHTEESTSVAVGPDGRLVARGRRDGEVSLWDASAGRELRAWAAHSGPVSAVAVSGDGRAVVSGGYDGKVRVWDAGTGGELAALAGHAGAVLSVAASADGQRVAAGGANGAVEVWDADGRVRLTRSTGAGAVGCVAVSPDGGRVAAVSLAGAEVWDVEGGGEVGLRGHTDLVYAVAFSPDGGKIATAGFDRRVKVWDARTGRELLTLSGHDGPVYSVGFSRDGGRVVSGSRDGTVRVWDAGTGRELHTLSGHSGAVHGVAVDDRGGRVLLGSRDGEVTVWPVPAPTR